MAGESLRGGSGQDGDSLFLNPRWKYQSTSLVSSSDTLLTFVLAAAESSSESTTLSVVLCQFVAFFLIREKARVLFSTRFASSMLTLGTLSRVEVARAAWLEAIHPYPLPPFTH
jgi:hypothetical protein